MHPIRTHPETGSLSSRADDLIVVGFTDMLHFATTTPMEWNEFCSSLICFGHAWPKGERMREAQTKIVFWEVGVGRAKRRSDFGTFTGKNLCSDDVNLARVFFT